MSQPTIVPITAPEDLDGLVRGHEAVVVVWWLRDCDMSRAALGAVEAFAKAEQGRVAVGEVEVDEQGELCKAFHVQEVPTLMFFRSGRCVMREIVPNMAWPEVLRQLRAAKDVWRTYFWSDAAWPVPAEP